MTIQIIQNHPVYQKVLKDSFGGVMYDVSKQHAYDSKDIIALWDQLTDAQRDRASGIMKGAMDFLKGN